MPALKILSWNIQKFGDEKQKDPNFIEYVARVIREKDADLVGIMEVVGHTGNEAVKVLTTALNNLELTGRTGVRWAGTASEMTPARPNEQYVYVWKEPLLQLIDHRLLSVVGGLGFDNWFAKYGVDDARQEDFWAALFKGKYINRSFQVPYPVLEWLKTPAAVVALEGFDLKPIAGVGDPAAELKGYLLENESQTFPVRGSRPPFLLAVRPAGQAKVVTVMLFHAPGPGNALPVIASNQLGLVPQVQAAQVGVVMGDFNVSAAEAEKVGTLQYFDFDQKRLAYIKTPAGAYVACLPFQRLIGPDFPVRAADWTLTTTLGYDKLLWTDKTSLKPSSPAADVVATNDTVAALTSSEYDKFFVRPKGTSAAFVFNAIDASVPKDVTLPTGKKILSNTTTTVSRELSELAAKIYNRWWDRQSAKRGLSSETRALLASCPKLTAGLVTSLREAHYAYRNAISDHLPIVLELRYA